MVRIIIKNPPSFMPEAMADFDGLYSLDLQPRSKIALTRQIDDYADPGAIKQDTFKQVDLLVSNKNRLLLGKIGNPVRLNQNNSEIFDIIVLKDDYSYPAQGLQVVESSDFSLSIIIFGELNTWIAPLSNLYLNEIDLGSAVVDFAFMEDLQQNHPIYEDGNNPVFPPLVNYGQWFINLNLNENSAPSQVVFNNYRFWVSPYALLKQAFCQVGHQLIAPFMQTEEFRRHWMYLLDAEFETIMQLDVANRPFEAENTNQGFFEVYFNENAAGITYGGIPLFNSVTDPGGHTELIPTSSTSDNYHGFFYSGGVIGVFEFNGIARLSVQSGPLTPGAPEFVTLKCSIRKAPKFGNNNQRDLLSRSTELASKTIVKKGTLISGSIIDFEYILATPITKVYQHEVVFVVFEYDAFLFSFGGQTFTETTLYPDTKLLPNANFKLTVGKQVLEEGDTIEFGKLLRKDLTALDVFKGIVHLPNMKTETSAISKEVSIYPEQEIDFFDSGLQEGFFKKSYNSSTFDATKKIQTKSLKQSFQNTELARNVYFKFATSNDGYILSLDLTDELHSKRIDLGANYADGTNEITNPLIQPLANAIDKKISGLEVAIFGPTDIRSSVNYIPFMWESTPTEEGAYPDRGYNFAPRIAIAYDITDTIVTTAAFNGQDLDSLCFFVYEDETKDSYNLFGQIFPEGIDAYNGMAPAFPLDLTAVYGNGININLKDYYQFIYENSIKQAYFAIALNFLVLLDIVDFSNLSFRNKWRLRYDSTLWGEIEIYCRLSSVTDYVIGGNITTSVELIPDNNNFIC